MNGPLTLLVILWGAVTTVLVILLIYRSTLTMHEDDQLFLDEAESHMQKEQEELLARMNKLTPFVRVFGAASGLLIAVIAGLWVWDALNRF
jgi:choline-glycine betaine transporter